MSNDIKKTSTKRRQHGPMGGGPMGGMGPVQKAKDFKGSMKKLLKELSAYKMRIIIVLIFAVLSTMFMVVGPKILGNATTKLFEGVMAKITGAGEIDFKYIGIVIYFLLVLYVVSGIFSYIQGYIMSGVAMKVTYKLRQEIFNKINRLPMKYFDKKSYGEVLSYVTNDVDTISQSLSQSLTQIITSVVTLIGFLIMMFTISWQMTLIALCVIPVSLIFILLVVKKSQKHFTEQQEYLGHVNGHIEEMYGAHVIVKAFNGEEESVNKFSKYNKTLYSSAWKSQFLSRINVSGYTVYWKFRICCNMYLWGLPCCRWEFISR